jgi:hypothetical protein
MPFLLLALALSAIVFFPITHNYFYSDDFLHLYNLVNYGPLDFIVRPHGGHVLLTRNAIFALFHYLFGTEPAWYFTLVLFTHLLNVYLLFEIIRTLTRSARLGGFGAALWGTSPLNVGALGWYSVYGHVLVATFVFWILRDLAGLAAGRPLARSAPVLWVILLVAASSSFGVGIGITLVMPVVAAMLVPKPYRARIAVVFGAIAAATLPVYFQLHRLTAAISDSPQGVDYLIAGLELRREILGFLIDLLGFGAASSILGVFSAQFPYPGPAGYLIAVAYAIFLVFALLKTPMKTRGQILAAVVLSVAAYGLIAAGRVLFVSPGNYVSMVQALRFHYVAPATLTIATCVALGGLGSRWPIGAPSKAWLLATWAAATLIGHFWLVEPIDHFDRERSTVAQVLAAVRQAVDGEPRGRDVYIENRPFHSGYMLGRNPAFPGWAGIFTIFFPSHVVDGRRVFFVTADTAMLAQARKSGARSVSLLVTPSEIAGER